MGLVNRVVAKGKAKEAALDLAGQIAGFPQICLRGDRLSAYEQFDLSFDKAFANELKHGLQAIDREAVQGASKFAAGAGRHGSFEGPDSEPA
jgi:enoyl-CoA hydratase